MTPLELAGLLVAAPVLLAIGGLILWCLTFATAWTLCKLEDGYYRVVR
ncbi:hypothetical protein ACM16X_04955 [Haloarcula japonica]